MTYHEENGLDEWDQAAEFVILELTACGGKRPRPTAYARAFIPLSWAVVLITATPHEWGLQVALPRKRESGWRFLHRNRLRDEQRVCGYAPRRLNAHKQVPEPVSKATSSPGFLRKVLRGIRFKSTRNGSPDDPKGLKADRLYRSLKPGSPSD